MRSFVGALAGCGQEIQTLMVVRHGCVVLAQEWAPYRLDERHLLFSLSKSFTSMAIGLLIDDGKLSLDDRVVSFFPAELPKAVSDNLAAMRIRDLLTMTTGHHEDTIGPMRTDPEHMMRVFLATEVKHEPGTYFVYNTGATYMLSAVLQRVTGQLLLDYLRPRLLEPLGMTEAVWPASEEGVTFGGFGLNLVTESIAVFGQFLLQQGKWQDQQLVPAAWVEAATARQVPNGSVDSADDWQQGYGYQFWQCRYGVYRGDGAFGQFCVVFPEEDAVVVITGAVPDMQKVLDVVWEIMLPALRGEDVREVARPDQLRIDPPTGASPPAGDGRTYRFEPNEIELAGATWKTDGSLVLDFQDGKYQYGERVVCAAGDWREYQDRQRILTSAHGAGDELVATVRFVETPFAYTVTCHQQPDQLTLTIDPNVGFDPDPVTLSSVSSPASQD
jgi:CubicO group peptidase (beta-lactamase class C family)